MKEWGGIVICPQKWDGKIEEIAICPQKWDEKYSLFSTGKC